MFLKHFLSLYRLKNIDDKINDLKKKYTLPAALYQVCQWEHGLKNTTKPCIGSYIYIIYIIIINYYYYIYIVIIYYIYIGNMFFKHTTCIPNSFYSFKPIEFGKLVKI